MSKRKLKLVSYKAEEIDNTFRLIKNGVSKTSAAFQCGVPRSPLQWRFKRTVPLKRNYTFCQVYILVKISIYICK